MTPPTPTGRPFRSCAYACRVLHHRLAPRSHRFAYGLFLLGLDLDELTELTGRLRLLSRNRRNLYEFRDRDHLEFPVPGAKPDLKSSLLAWLETQGTVVPTGARILLLTLPRVLGHVFNPVSFYFIHTADGRPVCAVAEVGNTFGELKPFQVPMVAPGEASSGGAERFRCVVPKHFYVSPFSNLELCFDFNLRTPDDRLEIGINDVTPDGQIQLISSLTGRRVPLSDAQLLRLTARYPLVTLRVITLIHWQAFRLWMRRLPWHRKAAHSELQRGVFRPHASLASLGTSDAGITPNSPTPQGSSPL